MAKRKQKTGRTRLIAGVVSVLAVAVNFPLLSGLVGNLPTGNAAGGSASGGSPNTEQAAAESLRQLEELDLELQVPPVWMPLADRERVEDPFLRIAAPELSGDQPTTPVHRDPLPQISLVLITSRGRSAFVDGNLLHEGAETRFGRLLRIERAALTFETSPGHTRQFAVPERIPAEAVPPVTTTPTPTGTDPRPTDPAATQLDQQLTELLRPADSGETR